MEPRLFFLLLFSALCSLSSCLYRQYHFVNVNMSWTEAQSYCRQNYTDLATIDSTEEMTRLISSVGTGYTGAAWIGLYDAGGYAGIDIWRWSLDGTNVSVKKGTQYTMWQNKIYLWYKCIALNNGTWTNQMCSNTYKFMCYNGANTTNPYIFISQAKNWTDAQGYCRQYYTDLASMRNLSESQQIQSIIQSMIPLTTNVWIGLYEDCWKWSQSEESFYSDGHLVYNNWGAGQPDNYGTEYCVVMDSSGQWWNMNCSNTYYYVCNAGGNQEYILIRQQASWLEAQFYCIQYYIDLVSVTDQEQNQQIQALVPLGMMVWTGLYRQCWRMTDLNNWKWSMGGERVTPYANWFTNDPNYALKNENFGTMLSFGTWRNNLGSYTTSFVCYNASSNATQRYVMIVLSMTWNQAQTYCRQYYTDLASARNSSENKQIQVLIKGYDTWIGLHRDPWIWSDRETTTLRYWRSASPYKSHGNENCAVQWFTGEKKWGNVPCDQQLPFFCYAALCKTPTVGNKLPWNHPSVAQFILDQVRKQMILQGMPESTKLSWKKQPNGDFYRVERKGV